MSARRARIGRPPVSLDGQTIPERLVEVARDLFAENGFERTSVQDLVDKAGVTKGAMYHYYSSKDELLAEIYSRVLRMQLARLQAFLTSEAPIEERVAQAAADVVVTTIENLPSTTIFFRSLHHLNPQHEREVRFQRRRYHDMFRQLILDGQQAGVFSDDIAADVVVDYFFGSVHHLPMWWRADRDAKPEEIGRDFASLLLRSLRPA
ncbi:MAG: TetR/AcrR family transcriptional regulator [Nocardioidaceae bacterium]